MRGKAIRAVVMSGAALALSAGVSAAADGQGLLPCKGEGFLKSLAPGKGGSTGVLEIECAQPTGQHGRFEVSGKLRERPFGTSRIRFKHPHTIEKLARWTARLVRRGNR
jgi:hypothetical protein